MTDGGFRDRMIRLDEEARRARQREQDREFFSTLEHHARSRQDREAQEAAERQRFDREHDMPLVPLAREARATEDWRREQARWRAEEEAERQRRLDWERDELRRFEAERRALAQQLLESDQLRHLSHDPEQARQSAQHAVGAALETDWLRYAHEREADDRRKAEIEQTRQRSERQRAAEEAARLRREAQLAQAALDRQETQRRQDQEAAERLRAQQRQWEDLWQRQQLERQRGY